MIMTANFGVSQEVLKAPTATAQDTTKYQGPQGLCM